MAPWFSKNLIKWYQRNKRDLPWRDQKDAYFIWLSEIILQQTQVAQGLAYYQRFVKTFPTVSHLATAGEDAVLKLWQGLGYYSRARNLHSAAIRVKDEFNGVFPQSYDEIKSLKGVGAYTAAAIASFAYDLPHAVVDGNVYRLLSRIFGISTPIDSTQGKKEFQLLANALLDKSQPALHNQAIMEFGSQYCRPVNPDCDHCIFKEHCLAFQSGIVSELPVKAKKIKQRQRYFNYVVLVDLQKQLKLQRRGKGDIWEGLFEFPLIETATACTQEDLFDSAAFRALCGKQFSILHISPVYKHILTHQQLFARFYVVQAKGGLGGSYQRSDRRALKKFAFSRLTEKFLDDCDLKELF